jgi:general secretion pathway protein G
MMTQRSERRKRRAGARRRGVTLFEVLIVVTILAMVTGAVAVVAIRYFDRAKIRMAETNARTVRAAVKGYWIENESAECPTVAELVRDETLDRDNASEDPWGSAWRIECTGRDVTIHSNGADRLPGTADDVRVPPV